MIYVFIYLLFLYLYISIMFISIYLILYIYWCWYRYSSGGLESNLPGTTLLEQCQKFEVWFGATTSLTNWLSQLGFGWELGASFHSTALTISCPYLFFETHLIFAPCGLVKTYPLVNVYITMERSTILQLGKSTISTGPFSIATLNYQRVWCPWLLGGNIPGIGII